MSNTTPNRNANDPHAVSVQYHENHVIGILDTPEAAEAAVHALTGGGFLESEVTLTCGVERADLLRANGTFRDAAAFGEVVVNATKGTASLEALAAAGAEHSGRPRIQVRTPSSCWEMMPRPRGRSLACSKRPTGRGSASSTWASGNTIPHLHIHFFPRYVDPFEDDPINPRAVKGPVYGVGEFEAMRRRIGAALEQDQRDGLSPE
jgi:hypothetical protein